MAPPSLRREFTYRRHRYVVLLHSAGGHTIKRYDDGRWYAVETPSEGLLEAAAKTLEAKR